MYALPVALPCLPTLYLWVPCSARRVFDASQVPVVGVVAVAVNAPKRRDFRGLDGRGRHRTRKMRRNGAFFVFCGDRGKKTRRTYPYGHVLRVWLEVEVLGTLGNVSK